MLTDIILFGHSRFPLQSVVLAHRPLISIPLSTISPALLDELTHEIGTLASVYHKPAEAFIGRGRVGVDELSRKEAREGLPEGMVSASAAAAAAANAIQVVAQGQRSENLLDFGLDDEEPTPTNNSSNSAPSMSNNNNSNALFGLDFGTPSTTNNNNFGGSPSLSFGTGNATNASARTAPTSQPSNTLDDLLGVFDQAGLGPGSSNGGIIGGMSNLNMTSSTSNHNDLFGDVGGSSGSAIMSPISSSSIKSPPPQHQQQQPKATDDLMGDLF